jgi:hypothetical protein
VPGKHECGEHGEVVKSVFDIWSLLVMNSERLSKRTYERVGLLCLE